MDKNILINFEFINDHGTHIYGQALMPYIKEAFYKLYNVTILEGYLDIQHRQNSGVKSEKNRAWKENIINSKCKMGSGELHAKITSPFLINEGQPIGLVKLMGLFNGYNSNREGKLFFQEPGIEKYKAAKLFQNLKNNASKKILEIISFQNFETKNKIYIQKLKANYNQNIKTASTQEMEIK